MSARAFSIKEAAALCSVSAHTLRYYEGAGLLPPVARDAGGRRRYTERDLGALAILLRLRATGMPVQAMRRFAALLARGDETVPERRAFLEEHGWAVRSRIGELEANLAAIEAKVALYRELEDGSSRPSSPHPPSLARAESVTARAVPQEV